MTNQELRLAAKMLTIASDEFGNHTCNDMGKDVAELVTDEDKLVKDITKWAKEDHDDDFEMEGILDIPDWMLMDYLAHRLSQSADRMDYILYNFFKSTDL